MTLSLVRPLTDWFFTPVEDGFEGPKQHTWMKVSQFPTTVHVELLKLKKIPDPFIGLHEWDVQWIGESKWAFKSDFTVTENELAASNADLIFDGVDTFASIDLNGHRILETCNQFVSYRVPVKPHLNVGHNQLLLTFESAFMKGRDTEKNCGKFKLWNGDSSRLHVRKAQYNYGWDWGPILMTVGPWKPISFHTYGNRITEIYARSQISELLDIDLEVDLTFSENAPGFVSFVLKKPDGTPVLEVANRPTDRCFCQLAFHFGPEELQLWYPVGYGEQPIYKIEARIIDRTGRVLDIKTQSIAFRRVRVIQEKLIDQQGLTFLFEINNLRIFCGGSNWIPADSFLTTLTPERYKAWLQLLVDGNQNMVRVWGGGIYESDVFYDICDELGILVWQDFMFACGQYPAYDSFVKSVREEAEQNVKRLRRHPSLVIFAGNNEDYQLAEQLRLQLDYSDEKSDFRKTNFPARHIYERVLPRVVSEFSNIYYHRGSPYSGHSQPTTDPTLGDLHQWNVWHGSQESWHNWDLLAGRFISEFGMQGYPNIRTVDHWLGGDNTERFPQSRTNNNHNKAAGFERRLESYLVENFRHAFDMESYVYYTQIMQAEALAAAYRLWRRNWRGHGREYTAGALVWQFNDCWPVTSWAIVDHFLRPKPAYFTIARELRPFTVGMTRKDRQLFPDERSGAFFTIDTILEIWGTNGTLLDKKVILEVTSFDLHSDWRDKWSKEVTLSKNSSTELFKGRLPGQPTRTKKSEVPKVIIVSARLLDENDGVLGRFSNWPEPFKFIRFPPVSDLGLKISRSMDGESLELSTQRPVKGIVLDVEGEDVKWSDQAIDLVPDDPQTIRAIGLNAREVKVRYLGDGSA